MIPPAMVMAPMESPKPGPGGSGSRSESAGFAAERDAGPVPEGQRVVRALVGVRSPLALARAGDVDDARVVGPDVVELDLELLAHPAAACW